MMYELAVRTDQPASTLSDIMLTPLLTGAAVVRSHAPEYERDVLNQIHTFTNNRLF